MWAVIGIIALTLVCAYIGCGIAGAGLLQYAFAGEGQPTLLIGIGIVALSVVVGGYGIRCQVSKTTLIHQSQEQKQFAEMSQTWRVVEHIKPGLVRVQREIGKTTVEGYADRESGWHVANEHEAAVGLPNLEDNKEGEHK